MKALADEIRLNIVRELASHTEPVPSCDIVKSCSTRTKLSQPAMSHHFSKLVDAGVLIEEKQGTQKLYRIDSTHLTSLGIDAAKL